jgi:hypothetical protein
MFISGIHAGYDEIFHPVYGVIHGRKCAASSVGMEINIGAR